MHLEIQVALNFVISYLYNKLPRRRVNIFGEELEKALKDKFQGHWYPDKPFKGSAFRCLKTGDPIDSVLERAARESGVPITDILENLPSELSVWVDPGEVSYRVGEKSTVKILYSENNDNQEDNSSADREVNKTFNPEAQCFRPIDAVNTTMSNLSISPKTSPLTGSSPLSGTSNSPTYKGSPNTATAVLNGNQFIQRTQAPLTFTTATFAQTKFGSTKLKTSSKRTNSSYRMSPTEFSNYIKQRAMQQQQQINHGPGATSLNTVSSAQSPSNNFGPIGPISPARSLSPNPLSLGMTSPNGSAPDPLFFPNMTIGMYPQYNGHNHHHYQRNLFDTHGFNTDTGNNCTLFGGQMNNKSDISSCNSTVNSNTACSGPVLTVTNCNGSNSINNGNCSGSITVGSSSHNKFSNFLEPRSFFGLTTQHLPITQQHTQQEQQQLQTSSNVNVVNRNGNTNNNNNSIMDINTTNVLNNNNTANITVTVTNSSENSSSILNRDLQPINNNGNSSNVGNIESTESNNSTTTSSNSKLIDNINSFYPNATGSYQQLLVAN